MHCLERSVYFGHCREWLVVDKKCDESLQSYIFFYNAEIGDSLVVLGCRGEKDTPEEQTGEKEFYHTIKIYFSVVR